MLVFKRHFLCREHGVRIAGEIAGKRAEKPGGHCRVKFGELVLDDLGRAGGAARCVDRAKETAQGVDDPEGLVRCSPTGEVDAALIFDLMLLLVDSSLDAFGCVGCLETLMRDSLFPEMELRVKVHIRVDATAGVGDREDLSERTGSEVRRWIDRGCRVEVLFPVLADEFDDLCREKLQVAGNVDLFIESGVIRCFLLEPGEIAGHCGEGPLEAVKSLVPAL